jgi:alpha-D-xyloside xylohydrolase
MRTPSRYARAFFSALPLLLGCRPAASPGSAVLAATAVPPPDDGPVLAVPGGSLKIQVCTADIVRVAFAKDAAFFHRASLITAPKRCEKTDFHTATAAGATTVTTPKLTVRIDAATGAVTFLDAEGRTVLAEKAGGGRTMTPATVEGEATTNVRQEWAPNDDESLYGLGQHQQGLLDIKGFDLDLHQYNTEVFVPMLVSSRGYGILWDNTSFTRFGDLADPVPLPVEGLYGGGGAVPGDIPQGSGSLEYEGKVTPTVTGDYTLRAYYSGTIKLSVDGAVVMDHYRQDWLPNEDLARVHLTAGKPASIKLSWQGDHGAKALRLLWKPPVSAPTTSLWSRVGDGVDYWFVYGPEIDQVVAGYRRLTGEAPMMPKWAFGLWQCKERYKTADEVTDTLKGFRSRGAPIDAIVQDWRYWPDGTWGSHDFDPVRYPDPVRWLHDIHDMYHAHLMISVWPRFYPETKTYSALLASGFLYPENVAETRKDFLDHAFAVYDAFNPAARRLYWAQINAQLFSKGVDAWWLDASEPEIVQGPFDTFATQVSMTETHMTPTALGSGARMLNGFALVNSEAVYEGQRAAAPEQRVFILTRSGFAGQQRYAAATWSGDITSTWTAMKKQIPAGLGFSVSGVPYWTFDTGGFVVPDRFSAKEPTAANAAEWAEMNTRWFEYATFLPLLRVHGQAPPREMWQFGGDTSPAYKAILKFDRLRYRLLPYVYSLAGAVTQEGGTMLRPLVMDFRADKEAREVSDEFMFGRALLVSPVTSYMTRERPVYLPAGSGWYDLWTGAPKAGGATVQAAAPFDEIPVYVKAGAIVPVGPDLQYTSEKPADPITLYVYTGADGAFSLYEDEGTTYDYEKGAFSTIPLSYSEAKKTLTIGPRVGSFPGMLAERTFQIVWVGPGKSRGFSFQPKADASVTYRGASMDVPLH